MTQVTHYLFAVRDAVADTFGMPFPQHNVAVATRGFAAEVNRQDKDNAYYTHSQDFALYELGTYDQTTGVITGYEIPKLVAQASSFKTIPQAE